MRSLNTAFACGLGLLLCGSVAQAQSLTDDQLPMKEVNGEKIPLFMHDGTFAGDAGWSWARDNVELEAAYTLTGIDGIQLYELLIGDGLENFERTHAGENWRGGTRGRRGNDMFALDAFSIGYSGMASLEEVPWSGTHHAIREGKIPWEGDATVVQPYVWLTIESGNFEVARNRETNEIDPRWGGRRRINLGTDTMDDVYYDDSQYSLLGSDMSIRSRLRFRDLTDIRRVLIALKLDRGVDEFGIKKAAKVDVRESSLDPDELASFEEDVMRGLSSWDKTPAVPLRRAWTYLKDRGRLESSPTYSNVLAIQPTAFIRSYRARFHFNEVRLASVASVYSNGHTRIASLRGMITEGLANGTIDASRRDEAEAWNNKARGLLDNRLIVERAFDRLQQLNFQASIASIESLLPNHQGSVRPGRGQSLDDIAERQEYVEQRRAVAETISELYHELAAEMDDGSSESLRRVITNSIDRELEDYAEWFVEWQQATKMEELGRIHGMDRFVELHEEMLGDAQAMTDFNDYGRSEWNDFENLTPEEFADVRFHLRNEQVRIWLRQIEEGGSAARGIWFDEAREFYVPSSSRVTGNLLIDTMDFPTMYDADVWGDMPAADRNPGTDLNQPQYRDHLIHSGLVNEVQIELTSRGAEYPLRLRELRSMVDLPRFFMKWAEANGASGEAEFAAIHSELVGLPTDNDDAALQTRIAPMNEFIEENGGRVLNYSAAEFRQWLDAERLTLEVMDDSYELPNIGPALEGAMFVFAAYRDMLSFLARLKQARVLEVMDRADAPNGIEWVPSVASKGQTALTLLRDGVLPTGGPTDPGPGGGGLIDVLTGNHTAGTASTVQRTTYTGLNVQSNRDDWYQIFVAPGEEARFTIDFSHAAGDLDMELYREGTSGDLESWTASESTTDQETVSYRTGSGRTVWVRVFGWSGAEGAYTLRVE